MKSLCNLTPYIDNVVQYITGYISFKLQKVIDCTVCKAQVIREKMPLLSKIKKSTALFKSVERSMHNLSNIRENYTTEF